jgi:hypothetical protein
VRWSKLTRFERLGAAFVVAFAGLLLLLPRWRVFNFDLSPRYLLPILPFVALLLGRAYERLATRRGTSGDTLGLVGGFGLAVAGVLAGGNGSPFVAVGACALALALARFGLRPLALAVALGLVALGPVAFADGTRLQRSSESGQLDVLVQQLGELHDGPLPRPVYTNEPLLFAYLQRTGALPWARVHYIVQADQRYELDRLANPDNGQRKALWSALEEGFYGTPVSPQALRPESLPTDVIFALRRDDRLEMVFPLEGWAPRLAIHHAGPRTIVAELRAAPEGGR